MLLGASRKSFISHLTKAPVQNRLPGSLAALAAAYFGGACMVRVHDVEESVQFLDILASIHTGSTTSKKPKESKDVLGEDGSQGDPR